MIIKNLRAIWRGIVMAVLAIAAITPGIIKSIFTKNYLPLALRMRQLWAIYCLNALGVVIDKKSSPPSTDGPYIFIGNHRSYLDPCIVLRDIQALPVAKAEVSNWPLIGYGAKVTGIMWVKRESKRSRANAIKSMEEVINDGYSVLIYPEGTTHIDAKTMRFSKGAFGLASSLGVGVVPIALEYHDLRDAWVNDDTFIPHFIRCFGKKHTYVKLEYGEPIFGSSSQEILEKCQNWIDNKVAEMRMEIANNNEQPVLSN